MLYKSSMALQGISHYLLPLLLTYYCILANVTVQADDITFQLTGRTETKTLVQQKFRHDDEVTCSKNLMLTEDLISLALLAYLSVL